MSLGNKLNTAKQVKNKVNAARNVKNSIRDAKGTRGGGSGSGGGRGRGTGGGKSKKDKIKKMPKWLIAVAIVAIIGIGIAAWQFGFLDGILEGEAPPRQAQDDAQDRPPTADVDGELQVHFIDVGQADAILVKGGGHAVLIDSGARNGERIILPYLESIGVTSLDVLVGTHPHADHIGGAAGIIEAMPVTSVWMPDVTHTTRTFERFIDAIDERDVDIHFANAGDVLSAGPIQMTVVHPNRSGYSSLNDYSVVLHLRFGETAFIFTGDGEGPTDQEILDNGWDVRSNVMLAGHHGSRTSSSEALIDAINPEIAVISVGEGNKYGHPHQVVLDRFAERDIEVLRTDLEGSIVLITDGTTVRRYGA